jgi:flagellin
VSSVNTNVPALIAQNVLRRNSRDMDNAMQRLSSGKRINSGADDPTGLAMATRIKSSSLSEQQGERNANDAISMLQVYSNAGQSVVDILIKMKELAVRAASDPFNQSDRMALDSHFNSLGQEWIRIAANTRWNAASRMDTWTNSFTVRLGEGGNSTTMIFKSWDPTNQVANQNVTGATAIMADDNNARTDWAWGFIRALPDLKTPINPLGKSHSHIQSKAASVNAVAKLDTTIAGAVAELAVYGAYINRLEFSASNSRTVATELNRSYSKIADADYAKETTELARTQILTQAATAILAQANQAPQMILKLLQ